MDGSDISDVAGTPNQMGPSPSPELGNPQKRTPYLQTIKQQEAAADNRLIENIPIFGNAPAAAITTLGLPQETTDVGLTKSITVGTTLGNLVALGFVAILRFIIRPFIETGHYNVFVGASRCSHEDILAMKKNDILIYRDQNGTLRYIVKKVWKKSFIEGTIERPEEGSLEQAHYDELMNKSSRLAPEVVTAISDECKAGLLKYTQKKGHTHPGGMSLVPFFRSGRTLSKALGPVGTVVSYFVSGDNPITRRMMSFLLSCIFSVVGFLIAIPYYLITGKFPNLNKLKLSLTGTESWPKYVRTFQSFFTTIGQFIGGVLVGALKNAGAAATSFGISFWSGLLGLGGVLLGFSSVPLTNYISIKLRKAKLARKVKKGHLINKKDTNEKGILASDDKNAFRNTYTRSGMLAFGAIGAVIGIPFGFLGLGPPVMATIFSAGFSLLGGVLFTIFGKKIHKWMHPVPKGMDEKKIDIENSWDYVGRSAGSVFGFVGAAVACMINPAAALVWAPVGAAIAGGIGWGLGILAMRQARKLKGNLIEKKASTLPWTQRITMGANIGSAIGSAIGLAVGLAGFVLTGPASVILAVSLFGAIGAVIGGIVGVLYEPQARDLIWKSIKDIFTKKPKKELPAFKPGPIFGPKQSQSKTESRKVHFADEVKQEVKRERSVVYVEQEARIKAALAKYLARIESHKIKGKIDFSQGFRFFKKSQAINREANYLLARSLFEKIDAAQKENKTFDNSIFKDLKKQRQVLIKQNLLHKRPYFIDRGVNSDELKAILEADMPEEIILPPSSATTPADSPPEPSSPRKVRFTAEVMQKTSTPLVKPIPQSPVANLKNYTPRFALHRPIPIRTNKPSLFIAVSSPDKKQGSPSDNPQPQAVAKPQVS